MAGPDIDVTDAGDGADVTYDSSIQEGTRYVTYEQWLVSGDDKSSMTESGGIGIPLGGASGGFIDFMSGLPGVIASALGVYFGLFKGYAMKLVRGVANIGG